MDRIFKSFNIAILAILASAWIASAQGVPAGMALIMAEEDGCIWCAAWDRDVSPEYAKTGEGRAAPLLRIDIRKPLPEGIELEKKLRFTPTFVLVRDGREISRLEGYPGEDFFWGLLQRMLTNAGVDWDKPS